jgi:hypothetical protein
MTTAKRVSIATAIAIAMVGLEFLVILYPGLSVPVLVRVALANMNLLPFAVAVRLAGGSSGPNLVVVGIVAFFQWFLVGFLVSLLFGRRRGTEPRSGKERP